MNIIAQNFLCREIEKCTFTGIYNEFIYEYNIVSVLFLYTILHVSISHTLCTSVIFLTETSLVNKHPS